MYLEKFSFNQDVGYPPQELLHCLLIRLEFWGIVGMLKSHPAMLAMVTPVNCESALEKEVNKLDRLA